MRKVEEAKIREEIMRKIAAQEKAKSQTAMRQAETARQLAEKEAQQRRDAELRATILIRTRLHLPVKHTENTH